MSRWETRTKQSRPNNTSSRGIGFGRLGAMLQRAGRLSGDRRTMPHEPDRAIFEHLETRVLLYGDHPGWTDIFDRPDPLPATNVILDASGEGAVVGTISPALDNDVFRFIAPGNDFVRIWADTISNNSTLDSRVEVYRREGPNHTPVLIVSGSHNNPPAANQQLTFGDFSDGWAGFIAEEDAEYFVVVRSDRTSGAGSVGEYTLRVNALSVHATLDEISGDLTLEGDIQRRGGDRVYRITSGESDLFNSLVMVNLVADHEDFDPRVEVYGAEGNWITGDSDTGYLSDSFTVFRGQQRQEDGSDVFYVRVRSDNFGDPQLEPSKGEYALVLNGIASEIVVDPVTRLGDSGFQQIGSQAESRMMRFQAQGTGLSFITIDVGFMGALPDSAVRLYEVNPYSENDGDIERRTVPPLRFNEMPGPFSRLITPLVGGVEYFVVVENFDGNAGGAFIIEIEAHHTYNQNQPVDDHASTPAPPDGFDPEDPAVRRQFELATPVVWSDPMPAPLPGWPGGDPFPVLPIDEDHPMIQMGRATGRIYTAADRDLFQFVPPVDMLGEFEGVEWPDDNPQHPFGGEAPLWHPFMRPATRLQVVVSGQTLFGTPRVRIFDSNFEVVYEYGTTTLVGLPGPPAGPLDPASFPPELPIDFWGFTFAGGQPADVEVWGGEVYYLEVSSAGGHGRYDVELRVDAPEDLPDVSQFYENYAQIGDWENAYEMWVDVETGDTNNFTNAASAGAPVNIPFTPWWVPPGRSGAGGLSNPGNDPILGRAFAADLTFPPDDEFGPGEGATIHPTGIDTPNGGVLPAGSPGTRGITVLRMSDLGTITSPLDAQLYQFRALYTGTAEIRINTTDLQDTFWEGLVETLDGDPETDPESSVLAQKSKVYQSPLHSALRIFNNDLVEVAFNAGNGVTRGERITHEFASFGERTFTQRDARVVIEVEAGKNYFVQVESGQRENFTLSFPKVDWRHATGSFELLINGMPNLDFDDDHITIAGGVTNPQATPIPLDLNIQSTSAVLGSVRGEIRNTTNNPNDTDLFMFTAPGHGTATVSVVTSPTGTFARGMAVYDASGTIRGTATGDGPSISVEVQAVRGERFWVGVEGAGSGPTGAQGEYEVRVSGIPHIDDHASVPFFNRATHIPMEEYNFTGAAERLAALEAPGDSDIFSFDAIAFDVANITVEGLSPTMVPHIRVYEISVDPVGNPILLQIGHNTGDGMTRTASLDFSVTAHWLDKVGPERRHLPTNENYLAYFVVISGADPNGHWGNYRMTLTLNETTDDHPDLGQWSLATPLEPGEAGSWHQSGVIEVIGDTDLFQFTAEARGQATITITSPEDSKLLPRVTIYNEDFEPIVNRFGEFVVTGPDSPVSEAVFSFTALRDHTYFVVVEGAPSAGNTYKTEMTGHYDVHLAALIADDHANEHEWELATEIILSRFTGKGVETGELEIPLDTDLFFFEAIVDGHMPVIVTVPNQDFRPFLRLFDEERNEIGVAARDGGSGDETGVQNGVVKRTIPDIKEGEIYFVLVSSDQSEPPEKRTGAYTVFLDGPHPHPGGDDHANAGEWEHATIIQLNPMTGFGKETGIIDYLGDSDLFVFTSLAGSVERPRPAQVWVTTTDGSILDLKVTIFGPNQQEIVSDSEGGPGTSATVDFNITGTAQKYWILVEHLGEDIDELPYTVHVQTTPEVFHLYYPEGYASHTVREYVAIVNPNDFEVNYTIRLRYEGDHGETIVVNNATIAPNSRGGVTLSDALNGAFEGVLSNTPYAVVIEADAFIGASLSHYDFGSTLGESFTNQMSDAWTFARGTRWPGSVNEFLVYYNPNPTPARVTLTAFRADGTVVESVQVVEGHRRGGWNFNQTEILGIGSFGIKVTSEALNPGQDHYGIIAALSHYDLDQQTGYSILGDSNGGERGGAVPGIMNGPADFTQVTFFNPSDTSASVTINGRYTQTNLPNLMTIITVAPRSFVTMDGAQLGMVDNHTMGMRWSSDVDLTVFSHTQRAGDADAATSGTHVANRWLFGDAFLNRIHAGRLYFENLFFYNPHQQAIDVTLNFYNNHGETNSMVFSLPGQDFSRIALHDLEAAMPRVFNWYGIEATADLPFLVNMTHYDLVLGGGWGSSGMALGMQTPIWRI